MPARLLTFLAVLALALAACSPAESIESTTSTTEPEPIPEPTQLAYSLEAGTTYTYDLEMTQTISFTTTGDPAAFADDAGVEGEDEDFPEQADIVLTGTSTITYDIADGPEPGTYEITVTGDFSDLDVTGTANGEPLEDFDGDVDDFTDREPIETTIVVDEQGNVIPSDDQGGDFLSDLGGLDSLGQLGGANSPGQFFGPPLASESVTVGDTWSETVEVPALPGADPITTTIEGEVVGIEEVDGDELFVIETVTTVSPIEFDLAEMLLGFMMAFVPEDASEEELAEMQQLQEQLRFVMSFDESTGTSRSLFDPEAGVARSSEVTSTSHFVFDINVPDDTTGDMVEFGIDMTMSQELRYTLVGTGGS